MKIKHKVICNEGRNSSNFLQPKHEDIFRSWIHQTPCFQIMLWQKRIIGQIENHYRMIFQFTSQNSECGQKPQGNFYKEYLMKVFFQERLSGVILNQFPFKNPRLSI
jgi:hypothetical protein